MIANIDAKLSEAGVGLTYGKILETVTARKVAEPLPKLLKGNMELMRTSVDSSYEVFQNCAAELGITFTETERAEHQKDFDAFKAQLEQATKRLDILTSESLGHDIVCQIASALVLLQSEREFLEELFAELTNPTEELSANDVMKVFSVNAKEAEELINSMKTAQKEMQKNWETMRTHINNNAWPEVVSNMISRTEEDIKRQESFLKEITNDMAKVRESQEKMTRAMLTEMIQMKERQQQDTK